MHTCHVMFKYTDESVRKSSYRSGYDASPNPSSYNPVDNPVQNSDGDGGAFVPPQGVSFGWNDLRRKRGTLKPWAVTKLAAKGFRRSASAFRGLRVGQSLSFKTAPSHSIEKTTNSGPNGAIPKENPLRLSSARSYVTGACFRKRSRYRMFGRKVKGLWDFKVGWYGLDLLTLVL